ncbi:hypothetical protein C8A00DRAFT_13676 [Chaetomidium leptoderma]|uniref:Armadillo-like helical domain-containing protein n=1 Tax=Chaetomidium leptoderma TaxID=669021 RepID=A0AAN6VQ00_9PEZI|nr:hypothetical protein C8A00DRAFT_13676 [Chaetomidium leptoderma]
MEPSPLTHQPRPEVFQPKIVRLYEALFKDDSDEVDRSEGFWKEFFLLRPDRPSLRLILEETGPNDLLQLQHQTRQLFVQAIAALRHPYGVADLHALDTLSTFMVAVLAKKYTNPSSDIIELLAGLDHVDTVFTEFVGALESLIRNGRGTTHECCPNGIGHVGQEEPRVGNRAGCTYTADLQQRAVEVALAVTSGAYQTSLLTYFIQRDLFPAIINSIQSHISSPTPRITSPFMLLGLLANYNKFEFQNPYQMRLNDFVNERVIRGIVKSVGQTCQRLRGQYIDVQEDLPEGWSLAGTLNKIGLGAIAPGGKPPPKPVYDAETAKKMFAELPGQEAAVLLATYDFTHANKLFSLEFVTWTPEKGEEQPFASFISLTSYLLQHAHLSQRTALYGHLSLMVFRLLIEDPILCKRICSEDSKVPVRLCRQRSPYLPLVRGGGAASDRILATAVMDTMVDALNHNLRRRLDVGLYTLCVGILLRIISYMSRSRTRLQYHWAELFRSLLSLVRFLTTYAADLKDLPHVDVLLDHVVNLIALGLSAGETFLPTPAAYDDLFYKVVETGEVLVKFRATYGLANRASNSIDTLVKVSTHYKDMLAEGGGGGGGGGGGAGKGDGSVKVKGGGGARAGSQLTSLQVAEVIKQGYETLSIQAKEGLDSWEKYREADERTLLKKMARAVVVDVRGMVAE